MKDKMRLKIAIEGPKVHDIGYRPFLLEATLDHNLDGFYAENKIKERQRLVEARVEGQADLLKEFQNFVESNHPPDAKVEKVSAEEYTGHVMNIDRYLHLLQIKQLEKGIQSLQNIDGKQDQALGKMDTMVSKHDQTIAEIKGVREDINESLSYRLNRIEADLNRVKEALGMSE